jgi:hypothetical protein
MNRNELRTGNLVHINGEVHQLQTVGQWLHTDQTVDEVPISVLQPIPLTEEWFEKTKDNWTLDEASDEHYEFSVDLIQCCQILKKELKYVHQLQNLYFALTGEELEFKD